jgi:hypothetical protein
MSKILIFQNRNPFAEHLFLTGQIPICFVENTQQRHFERRATAGSAQTRAKGESRHEVAVAKSACNSAANPDFSISPPRLPVGRQERGLRSK